ncbi:MAG TPA: hypothetical protein PKD55_22435 [Bellilinea sp.]|nr:hypothetical protein [Bellilinea sp.]
MKVGRFYIGVLVAVLGLAGMLAAFTTIMNVDKFLAWFPVATAIAVAGVCLMRYAADGGGR